MVPTGNLENSSIILEDGTEVAVHKDLVGVAKPNVLPELYYYYIVGEEIYEQLPNPEKEDHHVSCQVVDGSKDNIVEAGRILVEEYPSLIAIDFLVKDIQKVWSPVMLVGLFIGIVFFVSAGSFLYFRLYTDLDDDKDKFAAINKI